MSYNCFTFCRRGDKDESKFLSYVVLSFVVEVTKINQTFCLMLFYLLFRGDKDKSKFLSYAVLSLS